MLSAMKPCDCTDTSIDEIVRRGHIGATRDAERRWICDHCGGFLSCEFLYADGVELDEHPATKEHCGYFTCEKHLAKAEDLVASRRY